MRAFRLITAAVLVAIIAGGSWFAWRLWRKQQLNAVALAGVAPLPDLRRWPPAFRERLQAVMDEVARSDQPVKPLGELARLYQADGLTTEAEVALRVLRQLEPGNARWAYYLGLARLQREDPAGAAEQFRETVRLAPTFPSAWLRLAKLDVVAGRLDEARTEFARLLALAPGESEAALNLASLEHARGDHVAAIRRLEELARVIPRSIEVHQVLADIYASTGQTTLADAQRQLVRLSSSTRPSRDPWMEELYLSSYDTFRLSTTGTLLLQDGHPADALPYLVRAAGLAPTDNTIVIRLSWAYSALGRRDEARAILEQAISRTPQDAKLQVQLSEVLSADGRTGEAVELLQRNVARFPAVAELQDALGLALVRAGRFAEAIAVYRETLRLNPAATEAQLNLGRCLLQTGQRAEGRAAVARALEMRPDYADALLVLGRLALEDGDPAAANECAEKLLPLASGQETTRDFYALAKLNLGNRLASTGRFREAEQVYLAGLAVNPASGQLHGGLGLLHGKAGQLPEALADFQRYAELAPTDAKAFLALGRTLDLLQRQPEARAAYQRGLAAARQSGDQPVGDQLAQLLAQ